VRARTDEDVRDRGPWVKFAPPPRSKAISARMWNYLNSGLIETVATDHTPYSKESKEAGLQDIMKAPNGIPGLETLLPLMLTGVAKGRLSFERLSALVSENPSRMYGLYPRKGIIFPGSDADIAIVDPNEKWRIRNEDLITACGWTPYDGLEVIGALKYSFVRGQIILEDGVVVSSEGLGTFVPRQT
jgi:dihydroorotase-like cyclic amidohydrolase